MKKKGFSLEGKRRQKSQNEAPLFSCIKTKVVGFLFSNFPTLPVFLQFQRTPIQTKDNSLATSDLNSIQNINALSFK